MNAERLLPLLLLAGVAGCPGETSGPTPPPAPPPPPPPPAVASLTVSLTSTTVAIGQTVQASAVARDAANQVLSGVAVSWSSSVPGTATVSSTGLVTALSLGSTNIIATAGTVSGSARLDVVGATPNLTLENLYLTQAVQRYEGGLPLVVGGNSVLVNVFGTLTQPFPAGSPAPRVRVEIFSGNTLVLSDERPMTGTVSPQANPAIPLHQFVFPGTLVQPGLRIRATINPNGQLAEASPSDNTWPRTGTLALPVQAVPPLPVRFVPIFLTNGGTTGSVTAGNLAEYLTATRQTHPVSTVDTDIGTVFSSDVAFGNGGEMAWLALLQQLDLLRVTEGTARYYVGALRPPPGVNSVQFGGYGYIPADPQSAGPNSRTSVLVGVGWFNRLRQTTELVAHELAHNMGRRHAPCGGAANPDPLFPYQGGLTGVMGHDLYSWSQSGIGLPLEQGPGSGDLMSYCTPMWISDYTYLGLLAARGGPLGALLRAPGARCPCLVIWGAVTGDSIRLEPAFVIWEQIAAALPDVPGRFAVEGRSETGARLFQIAFEPVEIDHAPAIRHFTLAVPLAEGALTSLASLVATGPGRRSVQRVSGAPGPPAIQAERTGPSEIRLRWDAAAFPLLVVRNPADGRILQFARGGTALIPGAPDAVDVTASNGVRSTMLRVSSIPGGPR